MYMVKNRGLNILCFVLFFLFSYSFSKIYFISNLNYIDDFELIIGEVSKLPASWIGTKDVNKDIPILILAGHADSQDLMALGLLVRL